MRSSLHRGTVLNPRITRAEQDMLYAPTVLNIKDTTKPHPLTGKFHPESYGALADNVHDDGPAIRAAKNAAVAYGGGEVYLMAAKAYLINSSEAYATGTAGIYVPPSSGVRITGRGSYNTTLRTTSLNATEMIRSDTDTRGAVEGLFISIAGTAFIQIGVHTTAGSPGTSHSNQCIDVFVGNSGASPRTGAVGGAPTTDHTMQSTSPWVTSCQAAFAAGDVGNIICVSTGNSYVVDTVQAVRTLSGTLAAAVTSTSANTLTLNAAIANQPTTQHAIQIDSEIMIVIAGFGTTSLTVSRGAYFTTAATHLANATASCTQAQLSANAPATAVSMVGGMNRSLGGGTTPTLLYGFGVGTDHAGASNLDIAGLTYERCTVQNAAVAGFHVGNGTSGNVLDIWASHTAISNCTFAILAEGAVINGDAWTVSGCAVDYKCTHATANIFGITNGRSEDSGRLFEGDGLGTTACVVHFTDYELAQPFAGDGGWIRAAGSSINLTLTAVSIFNAYATANLINVSGASANLPAKVTLEGCTLPSGTQCPGDGTTTDVWEVNCQTSSTANVVAPSTTPFRKALCRPAKQTVGAVAVSIDAGQQAAVITLTAANTSCSITNTPAIIDGRTLTISVNLGGFAFTWPANIAWSSGAGAPGGTTGCTTVCLVYNSTLLKWVESSRTPNAA